MSDYIKDAEDMMQISKKRYKELSDKEDWLVCLEQAGVDNWSGIDYAYQIKQEQFPESEND